MEIDQNFSPNVIKEFFLTFQYNKQKAFFNEKFSDNLDRIFRFSPGYQKTFPF